MPHICESTGTAVGTANYSSNSNHSYNLPNYNNNWTSTGTSNAIDLQLSQSAVQWLGTGGLAIGTRETREPKPVKPHLKELVRSIREVLN